MLSVQPKFVSCMLLLPGSTSCVTFSLQFRSYYSSDLFLPFSPDFLISVHHLRSFHSWFSSLSLQLSWLCLKFIFTWFLVNLSSVCPHWYSPLSLPSYFCPTEVEGEHSSWSAGLSQTLLQHSMANYLESLFFCFFLRKNIRSWTEGNKTKYPKIGNKLTNQKKDNFWHEIFPEKWKLFRSV